MSKEDLTRRVRRNVQELTFEEKKALLIECFEARQNEANADSKTLDDSKVKVDKLTWLIDWAKRQLAKKKE